MPSLPRQPSGPPSPPGAGSGSGVPEATRWRCISDCGACCRLDPAQRQEAIAALSPEQQDLYMAMVGRDGWCVHFDTGGRRCRIYADRPDFCRVENLQTLFGAEGCEDPEALAITSCIAQIRAEYGGRGRVMGRFLRAVRSAP